MSTLRTILVLAVTFLAVFFEASWDLPRRWLGAQVDFLPGLMVYAGLAGEIHVVALVAVMGGLWFDSLSANPLGVTPLPLFSIGLTVQHFRHLILRDEAYAQWLLGLGASAAAPALSVLLLTTIGTAPMIGFGFLWQWLIMSVGGAACTPLWFLVFDRLERVLSYQRMPETSFRSDREIARGRH